MSAKREDPEASALDVTTLFPGPTVRSQLYRQEPKLPRLPLPSADLVGTTAALFLQHMIHQSMEHSKKKEDDLCTVSDIQAVIDQTPALAFLKDPFREGIATTDQERFVEYQPAPKKKSRVKSSAGRTTQKALIIKEMGTTESTSTNTLPSGGEIVVDEDDYD